MTKPIGDSQTTAESWQISVELINAAAQSVLVFKDENGIYHTVNPAVSTAILDGTTDAIVLTGEIVEPQPVV